MSAERMPQIQSALPATGEGYGSLSRYMVNKDARHQMKLDTKREFRTREKVDLYDFSNTKPIAIDFSLQELSLASK